MGDEPRIQMTEFVGAVGGAYVLRPGMTSGEAERFGYQALIGVNLDVFVDAYRDFRLLLAGTVGREEAFEGNAGSLTTAGAAVEAYLPVVWPAVHAGIGLNPRAVISDSGRSPEFELGFTARLAGIFGDVGLSLNVAGGLRLADIKRSSFEVGFGAFLSL
ncbi:MAG TPA: hypothetical protein VFX30_02740 [bacterium]|nr:hypothetical protein [bacterium]